MWRRVNMKRRYIGTGPDLGDWTGPSTLPVSLLPRHLGFLDGIMKTLQAVLAFGFHDVGDPGVLSKHFNAGAWNIALIAICLLNIWISRRARAGSVSWMPTRVHAPARASPALASHPPQPLMKSPPWSLQLCFHLFGLGLRLSFRQNLLFFLFQISCVPTRLDRKFPSSRQLC